MTRKTQDVAHTARSAKQKRSGALGAGACGIPKKSFFDAVPVCLEWRVRGGGKASASALPPPQNFLKPSTRRGPPRCVAKVRACLQSGGGAGGWWQKEICVEGRKVRERGERTQHTEELIRNSREV